MVPFVRPVVILCVLAMSMVAPAQTQKSADVVVNAAQRHSERYEWFQEETHTDLQRFENRLENRLPVPKNARRTALPSGSFGSWLRGLPLKRKHTPVRFYNGRLKPNQNVHEAVVDIDIGTRNLQQCADSLIRLRAEYLYAKEPRPEIAFHYTSGHRIPFSKWAQGLRPILTPPNKSPKKRWTMAWKARAKRSDSRKSFNAYLENIFSYAGTMSLSKNLPKRKPHDVQVGDIYLEGGFPGHTVMVVDKAIHAVHGPLILIAQGFMPAQSFHVLKNTYEPTLSPWFRVPMSGRFYTPEFTFNATDLYYFED